MPQREGPRLKKEKHALAEERLRRAFLEGRDYRGKDEDLALVKRKHRELSPERVRRVIAGEGRVER